MLAIGWPTPGYRLCFLAGNPFSMALRGELQPAGNIGQRARLIMGVPLVVDRSGPRSTASMSRVCRKGKGRVGRKSMSAIRSWPKTGCPSCPIASSARSKVADRGAPLATAGLFFAGTEHPDRFHVFGKCADTPPRLDANAGATYPESPRFAFLSRTPLV
jgi:hypothetical protein